MPMHDGHTEQRPSGFGLRDGAGDLGLRHVRIMFDFKRREPAALVAAEPDKSDKRTDVRTAG
jgi:hypothetical protein